MYVHLNANPTDRCAFTCNFMSIFWYILSHKRQFDTNFSMLAFSQFYVENIGKQ